jgi:hypothetical protein
MPEFIKGLGLSRLFYEEAVRPLLEESFPGLRYAAALLGTGSEVLGFELLRARPGGQRHAAIDLHGYAQATLARIRDERVRRIAARRPVGNVDLFSDSTDLVSHASWRATLRKLYE